MAVVLKIKVYQKHQNQFLVYDQDLQLFKIYISAVREKGKANKQIVLLLSRFFSIPQYSFCIISGKTTTLKLIKVETHMELDYFISKVNDC